MSNLKPLSILDAIEHWAAQFPERIAHMSGPRLLTYRELWERSDALAVHLIDLLPADSSPVAVRGHKEPGMLIAFLACVKAGHPYVPIDRSMPEDRAQRIIAASQASLVLQAADLPVGVVGAAPDRARQVGPDETFYIIYTSGSTGEPKGVQIPRSALQSFVDWMLSEHPLAAGAETFLNQAPFSFDLSVMDLYLSLTTGGTLYSLESATVASPKALFQALALSGVTTWVSTPSFALICLAEPTFHRQMLPFVRRFLFCGETLPADCAARLLERFPGVAVWNAYGPTEATVATTSVQIDEAVLALYNPLPVGYPKPDSQILLMNEASQPVAEGERGEIVIVGPNVATGYLNNPEQTARDFFVLDQQRAYRTGDWGYMQNGLLFFEGRMDFQIKLHGYRIELGEIEANLRALPEVAAAVVLPYIKDGKAEWLAAFVVLTGRPTGTDFALSQELRQALGLRLPTYMLPRKFFILERFPLTPNGKADRRQLGAMLE